MTNAQHTPYSLGIETDTDRAQIINVQGEHVAYVGISPAVETAAFIVKAVNSYKQLISTIQTIQAMASHGDYGGIETLAAEAIAKAEGK